MPVFVCPFKARGIRKQGLHERSDTHSLLQWAGLHGARVRYRKVVQKRCVWVILVKIGGIIRGNQLV